MGISDKKVYQEVYPFTTENIQGYMKELDLEGKNVLTVGSSLDQAYNALALGANTVRVLDINANTKKYCAMKSKLILSHARKDLYRAVMSKRPFMEEQGVTYSNEQFNKTRTEACNYYLQNQKAYNRLRQRLNNPESLTITEGNIFRMDEAIGEEKFDRICFSNVLQMLDYFKDKKETAYDLLEAQFPNWSTHLTNDGILQLFYLYSFRQKDIMTPDNKNVGYDLSKVVKSIRKTTPAEAGTLDLVFFDSCTGTLGSTDAAVLYTKRR
ncbi:MAG: hypothetical protein PUE33_03495 [bacterium]|nr:hypothetical protein [Mycoplasmatota bacterium]MDD6757111.1 hypothetical protein [bacterium]MDY2908786.1 hypothetical protein [Candidatus Faecimonas sp.]